MPSSIQSLMLSTPLRIVSIESPCPIHDTEAPTIVADEELSWQTSCHRYLQIEAALQCHMQNLCRCCLAGATPAEAEAGMIDWLLKIMTTLMPTVGLMFV